MRFTRSCGLRVRTLFVDTPVGEFSFGMARFSGRASGANPVHGVCFSSPSVSLSTSCGVNDLRIYSKQNKDADTKKAWNYRLPVPRIEALALPIRVEQATLEIPRRYELSILQRFFPLFFYHNEVNSGIWQIFSLLAGLIDLRFFKTLLLRASE